MSTDGIVHNGVLHRQYGWIWSPFCIHQVFGLTRSTHCSHRMPVRSPEEPTWSRGGPSPSEMQSASNQKLLIEARLNPETASLVVNHNLNAVGLQAIITHSCALLSSHDLSCLICKMYKRKHGWEQSVLNHCYFLWKCACLVHAWEVNAGYRLLTIAKSSKGASTMVALPYAQ